MRILWINSDMLFPLDRGGNIRTYNILRFLKTNNDITYVSYLDDSRMSENDIKDKMRTCSDNIEYVKVNRKDKFSFSFYFDLVKNIFSIYPYVIQKYYSKDMEDVVSKILEASKYDLVICDFLFSSIFIPKKFRNRIILFQHNVESIIRKRHYETECNIIKKSYLYYQWVKLFRYERKTSKEFLGCIAVSDKDEDMMREYGVKRIQCIPTGVDTDYFSPDSMEVRPGNIVFTGSMDWIPNEDGVIYFVDIIYPKLLAKNPDVSLTIVGRNPSEKIMSLKGRYASIEVTGTVKDVRPYMGRAEIYVVPLRIGGGTRIKIFEAMSMGMAVVSTSLGAEGLPVENGRHIVIADGEESFAARILELLEDGEKRRTIGCEARSLMVNKYDWKSVGRSFEAACRDLMIR
jgi:polysaccharide biosynthesis protein PslH